MKSRCGPNGHAGQDVSIATSSIRQFQRRDKHSTVGEAGGELGMHVAAGPGRSRRNKMSSRQRRSFLLIVTTQQLHIYYISFYWSAKQWCRKTMLETTQLAMAMIRCTKQTHSSQRSRHKDDTEPNKDKPLNSFATVPSQDRN